MRSFKEKAEKAVEAGDGDAIPPQDA